MSVPSSNTAKRKTSGLYRNMQKELILNVDDLGLHRDIVLGVEELFEQNSVSTVSVISTSSILDETIARLKKIGIPVGVHLILDGVKPVLDKETIPAITDDRGFLFSDENEIKRKLKPEEAFNEFSAQIENIQKRGVCISHLDSHRGFCFIIPKLWKVYRELGKKYALPLALPKHFIFNGTRKCVAGSSDSLIGVYDLADEESVENRLQAYDRMLSSLSNGKHYCFSHPAPPTQAIRDTLPDFKIRTDDYALFLSPEWKELLKKHQVTLSSF